MEKARSKAYVVDEKTSRDRWFIYIDNGYGRCFAARFRLKDNADRVCAAINRAYENEQMECAA